MTADGITKRWVLGSLLIIVLVFKPTGLFGEKATEKV